MVSRVLYRPFDTEDFDAIALILQQLWHNNSDNDEYNRLEAACDLAYCLSSSTFSQVAVIDGQARGISLARADRAPAPPLRNIGWIPNARCYRKCVSWSPMPAPSISRLCAQLSEPTTACSRAARCRTTTRSRCLPWIAMSTAWALARCCSTPRYRTCPRAGDEGAPVHRLQLLVEVLRAARL